MFAQQNDNQTTIGFGYQGTFILLSTELELLQFSRVRSDLQRYTIITFCSTHEIRTRTIGESLSDKLYIVLLIETNRYF